MKTENRWIGKQRSAEEELLIDTVENNSDLFDDMLFKDGTPCRRFLAVQCTIWNDDEVCLPDQLKHFSYTYFDFSVENINGDVAGEFNAREQHLIIEPEHLNDEANVLCAMIYLHEFVLNDLPIFFHDAYLYGLYRFLKSQIDNLDELIYKFRYIFNEQIEGKRDCLDYDMLFLLKSFDLDLKKGYDLGTVIKHRCGLCPAGRKAYFDVDRQYADEEETEDDEEENEDEEFFEELVMGNASLFDDMLFKRGTICDSFCSVQLDSGETATWYDRDVELPMELDYFSYYCFKFLVKKFPGDAQAAFYPEEQTLIIDPKYLGYNILILHEMIHMHEFVLDTLPSMVYHDLYLYCLYQSLKDQIPDLDEYIERHGNTYNDYRFQLKRGKHDLLFFLKSLDLDIKEGYQLGTVFGYGYNHKYNSEKVAS